MKHERQAAQVLVAELAVAQQQIAELEDARSEREFLETSLRKSEERFRIALQNSNIVVYNQDQDLRYTWIYNPQLGYTPEGILGKTDADILLPEDAAPLEAIKRRVLATGSGVRETVRTTIDGAAYYYDLTVEPLRDSTGEIIGITGASRDITAQVCDRRALEESEERYRLLAENASDVVWITDLHLRLIYVSPSIERLRGYTAQQVMDQRFEETVTPDSLAVAMAAFTEGQAIEQSEERDPHRVRTLELEFLCKDGSTVWTESRISYIRTPGGESLSITGVTRDITERKQAEQALQVQSRALGERVKELNCLYGMSRLRDKAGASLAEILQGAADLIPPAWQHPEITAARVILYGQEFRTGNFREDAPCHQSADIAVHGEICGVVQVCYDEEMPECNEGPFLKEERSLLNAIAERMGRIAEHMRAEEALRAAREELEERVQERTSDLERGHQREQVLNALLRLSMEEISLDEQLQRALDEILAIPWLPVRPKGGIFLVGSDSSSGEPWLELRAQRGFDPTSQIACRRVDFGQCLCGRAAASGKLLFADPDDEHHEIQHEAPEPYSHYCVPIPTGDRPMGVIVLYLEEGYPRDAHQEEFLEAVTHTLAGIVERKRVEEALRRSEAGLAEAQRIARLGNWDWDIEANRLVWSDEIYRIFGLAPQEFGATYEAFLNSVHPDDRDFVQCSVDEALDGQMPYDIDHRILLPDGTERIVHEQAEITYGPEGQPVRLVGTVQDVTQRKEAEVALRQSELRLLTLNEQLEDHRRTLERRVAARTREIERRRQVAESLREMLAILNSNRPLDEILRFIVSEAGGLLQSETSAIYRLIEPDGVFEVQIVQGRYAELVASVQFPPGCRRALRDGHPAVVSDASVVFPSPDLASLEGLTMPESMASYCPSMLAVPLMVAGEVYGGLVLYYSEPQVFSREEVELAVAFADQAALAMENAGLRQQAEVAAVLAERERLARDLHDSVTQSLYSITLLAEGWKRLENMGRLDAAEDPLGELGEIAQQALKEMRLLVYELRPPDLEKVGLVDALHQRLGAVEKRAGVDARLVAGDVLGLPPELEETLYRIAIEALNNTLKHANATEVVVRLQPAGEGVTLEVRDNGIGFDASDMEERRGVGLSSMRERAERMGGELTIESEPGKGTKVEVRLGAQGSS